MIYFTTGGTMGRPLGLYNLRNSGGRERAFIYSQWARVGFHYNDRCAMLRGRTVTNKRHWKAGCRRARLENISQSLTA